jgi:hypothetical protein
MIGNSMSQSTEDSRHIDREAVMGIRRGDFLSAFVWNCEI